MLSKKQISELFNGIYLGIINPNDPPVFLYEDIFDTFDKKFIKAFKVKEMTEEIRSNWGSLRKNINRFSAAKTFQQVLLMGEQIKDKKGNVLPFKDFEKKAKPIYNLHNKTWMQVESDLIEKQGIAASEWHDLQTEIEDFPLLQYKTIGDGVVRPEHAILDGVIRPVNDLFWDEFYPPNGYRCRCFANQLDEGIVTDLTKTDLKKFKKEIDLQFRNNPAKSGFVIKEEGKDKHPYFEVSKKYEKLKKNNFNLPTKI